MRIAIFTESYEPIVNGVSVFVSTLRDELVRRGHNVFIFAPRFEGYQDERDGVFRWPSRHTIFMPDYPFPSPIAPGMRRVFESLGVDVVHTQTPFILGVTAARWVRRLGIPLVSTNHTLYTEYAHYVPVRPKVLTKLFLVRLMKWYYSRCDVVVTPSAEAGRILRSYGVTTRIEVIKTGIVPASPPGTHNRQETRRAYSLAPDDFVLLYVGRVAREKNLEMLLRALRKLADRYPNLKLIIVGGGPAFGETRQLVEKLALTEHVRFTGMLSRDQIDPIYSAADLFVFPSATETQGIAICEAMSAGLPVVAVNAGGIPENIQDGVDGFLTANEPGAFADRIEFLITHENERTEMGARARANARSFSIERMADDFERLYSSVIESRAQCSAVRAN
ncbi:MAG: glycosyltransferase family 4 protein [Armatimonadota bacterium]